MAVRGVSPHRRTTAVAAVVAVAVAIAVAVAPPAAAADPPPAPATDTAPKWAYFGPRGPAFWGTLDPDWKVCETGLSQSPIDVMMSSPVGPLPVRELASQNDHAVMMPTAVLNGVKYSCVEAGTCGTAVWAGYTYDLIQMHLHVSSEHTINGLVFPAELHLVHAADDGNLLVVGILLQVGAANMGLEKLLAATTASVPVLPGMEGGMNATLSTADWESLVSGEGGWCQYAGSLTTPPCTEGVTWAVASTPRTASADQLRRLGVSLLSAGGSVVLTDRPVQPLNGRTVTCYSDDDMAM